MSATDQARGSTGGPAGGAGPQVTADQIWHQLTKASFAVLSYVTPTGAPRSAGVVYTVIDRRLWVATAPDSWKARHIEAGRQVAVTVPVRRGGILALMAPIPPATISFHASVTVHPGEALRDGPLARQLGPLLPPDRRDGVQILEISPEGHFLTYGVGVPLLTMRVPARSRARIPVA